MGGNGRGLELPGGVRAVPPTPDQQLLTAIAGSLDALLQLQARIALGWDPADAVKDMELNVPEPPVKADRAARRRAKFGDHGA